MSLSACGPGTFTDTWGNILSGKPSKDKNTAPSGILKLGENSFFKGTRLETLDTSTVYGVSNRQQGLLALGGNPAMTGVAVQTGDLNGDGIDDLIIGAPESEGILDQTTRSGWVYVVLGKSKLAAQLDIKQEYDIAFVGGRDTGHNRFGQAVVVADLNGDSIDDLAIGAPFGNGTGNSRMHCGMVYVLFGPLKDRTIVDLSQQADLIIEGARTGDETGFSLAAGDLNGDRKWDLIIGAPNSGGPSNRKPGSGAAYIFYGRERFPRHVDLAQHWDSRLYGIDSQPFSLTAVGEHPDHAGFAVNAGDFNGDGLDDALIGAPFADGYLNEKVDAGESYVIFGRLASLKTVSLSKADLIVYGVRPGDHSGYALATANLNGDALDDWIIGSPSATRPLKQGSLHGVLHGLFGRKSYPKSYNLISQADLIFSSDNAGRCASSDETSGEWGTLGFGRSLVALDVNGDGKDEVVAGMPCSRGKRGRPFSGDVLFFFPDRKKRMVRPLWIFQPSGAAGREWFGYALARGDVDGDGRMDLIIGAPGLERTSKTLPGGGVYVLRHLQVGVAR